MAQVGAGRGMSLTTTYDVKFDRPGGTDKAINLMCDEAQLPNVQAATAQMAGRYLGEGPFQYPHTRLFTDVSLGFLCDADLNQLKYFHQWYGEIFDSNASDVNVSDASMETMLGKAARSRDRINRLNYPSNYTATTYITKLENQGGKDIPSITYLLEGSYPYAIDAVPLSYGSSQITRVNVNFHYVRHSVIFNRTKGSLVETRYNSFDDGSTPTSRSLGTGP